MEEKGIGGVGGRIRFFWKGKEGKGGGGEDGHNRY